MGKLTPLLALAVFVTAAPVAAATIEEARAFVERAEAELLAVWIDAERANWVQSTYITEDTEILSARANGRKMAATVRLAQEATRFDDLELPVDVSRRLQLLKLSLELPGPREEAKTAELARIVAGMESAYSRGKVCPPGGECMTLEDISRRLASSRDPEELLALWQGWHAVAPFMRADFERYVELANQGARDLGFADLGTMWRSKYDMPPEAFATEVDRLWEQVRPLYEALHCYVRGRLQAEYGEALVPSGEPIPAHLLGNMWAQSWENVVPLLAAPGADPGYDLGRLLEAEGVDAVEMVRIGERFFTAMGFEPLPESFWQRSMFTRPRDREVVCHASAWDVDWADDLRLKMCIEPTGEDFITIHHELGHNVYQRAYNRQPVLFRDGANDGFHEAVGDTLALSITPDYLVKIGLLDRVPESTSAVGRQLRMALDRVAFLPFGLLVDQFRWQVFSGKIPPAHYNDAWWRLRERYQGVRAPVERSEADFDPGAKYHVAASRPYTRYFLASILQFQFHRALCRAAGFDGPLDECSIYRNAEAGRRLREMLAMGMSRPWPDALEKVTGQREMDASALMEYFAPLQAWLDERNRGQACGW